MRFHFAGHHVDQLIDVRLIRSYFSSNFLERLHVVVCIYYDVLDFLWVFFVFIVIFLYLILG